MKKYLIYFNILFICILLTSCNLDMTKIVYNKKKPFNFYYTNEIAKHITLEKSFKVVVFESNLYKEEEISNSDKATLQGFIKELNKENFIKKPSDLPQKPIYKLYINFSKDKYIINVYNDKYVSVYPWDGNYDMDYIDMSNIHVSNNLFYLCSYILPRHN